MFGCKEITKYLIECDGDSPSMEEVISIYCLHKYSRGHSSGRILGKIRQLCAHLRMIGRADILLNGREALRIIALEVSLGGARLGHLPAITKMGKIAANDLRRLLVRKSLFRTRNPDTMTDAIWGGPLAVESITKEKQRQVCRLRHFDRHVFGESWTEGERPEWADVYFIRRPALGSDGHQPLEFIAEDLPLYMTLSRLEATLAPTTPDYVYEARVTGTTVEVQAAPVLQV